MVSDEGWLPSTTLPPVRSADMIAIASHMLLTCYRGIKPHERLDGFRVGGAAAERVLWITEAEVGILYDRSNDVI